MLDYFLACIQSNPYVKRMYRFIYICCYSQNMKKRKKKKNNEILFNDQQ